MGMKKRKNWSDAAKRRSYRKRQAEFTSRTKRDYSPKFSMYFDRKGRRIDFMRWAKLTEDWRYGTVEQTYTHHHWISTRLMGIDFNGISWYYGERPFIFETMIFCRHDDADAKHARNAERLFAEGRKHLAGEETDIVAFGKAYEEVDCEFDHYSYRTQSEKDARKNHWRTVNAMRKYEQREMKS
jgi:hypothetical protein